MIEDIVREHLIDEIQLPVYLEEPERPPQRYMLIGKTGSGGDSASHAVGSAMIIVQSYAPTLSGAALLNEQVKQAMWRLEADDRVTKVRCNSDLNYTDTETRRYRYQALFEITYYN
jgi:hypothetical protein